MKRSPFHKPKQVLVFNGAYVLISITRSIRSAAEVSGCNAQAVSFACIGKYISAGALYYRHLHPDVEVDMSDLGALKLQDYDKLCSAKKRYHSRNEISRRKKILNEKRKVITQTEDYDVQQ